MDPMTPEKPTPEMKDQLMQQMSEAKASGKLNKLQDLMTEYSWPEDAESILLLAQKDDRTKGKSPDELADMIRGDTSLYDDLVAYKPGGALEKLGQPAEHPDKESAADEAVEKPGAEGVEEDEAMKAEAEGVLSKSKSMKDMSPDRAAKAMKETGFKPGKDDMDLEKKSKFMSKMYGA